MTLLVDSFSRALAQTFQPKVIGLSLLPLVLMSLLALGLGYFFWDPAVQWMRASIDGWPYVASVWGWLDRVGAGALHGLVAPFLLLLLIVPVVVLAMLAIVAVMMTPTLVSMVGRRRYPMLERKKGASFAASVWWSLSATAIALIVLVLSMPLWLIPPLVLILPPLIWGWLTYRVMAFDAMAEHASASERRASSDAPAKVPTVPIAAPVMKKMRMMAPDVAPMVRRIAMSLPLSFTSMMRPEMMLSAATSTISVRIMNMTLRSTSSAEKKVRLRWRQSVTKICRPAAASIGWRRASTSSGLETNSSIDCTMPSALK